MACAQKERMVLAADRVNVFLLILARFVNIHVKVLNHLLYFSGASRSDHRQ